MSLPPAPTVKNKELAAAQQNLIYAADQLDAGHPQLVAPYLEKAFGQIDAGETELSVPVSSESSAPVPSAPVVVVVPLSTPSLLNEGAFAPGQTLTSGPPPGISAAAWLSAPSPVTGQLLAQLLWIKSHPEDAPSWVPIGATLDGFIAALVATIERLGPAQFPVTYPQITQDLVNAALSRYASPPASTAG